MRFSVYFLQNFKSLIIAIVETAILMDIKEVVNRNVAVCVFCFIFMVGLVNIEIVEGASSVDLYTTGATETTISLQWSGSNDLHFSSYKLFESTSGVNGPYTEVWSTADKGQTTTHVSDLSPDTNYYFYITDSDRFEGSFNSNTIQAKTTANPTLQISGQTSTATNLSWHSSNVYSSEVPFRNWTIQMSSSGESGPWYTLTTITDPEQSSYVITGFGYETFYVRVYDTAGNGYTSYSNTVTVPNTTATPQELPPITYTIPIVVVAVVIVAIIASLIAANFRRKKTP
jgi:hypothetical protein